MLGTTTFQNYKKNDGGSIVWKEIINHRKYIGASLRGVSWIRTFNDFHGITKSTKIIVY